MAEPNNKFDVSTSWGEPSPEFKYDDNETEEFARDGAGVPNPNQGEKTDLNMGLEPNKFPRETGHDSLSEEDLYST